MNNANPTHEELIRELLSAAPMSMFKLNAILLIAKKLNNLAVKDLEFVRTTDGVYCPEVVVALREMEQNKEIVAIYPSEKKGKRYMLSKRKLAVVRAGLFSLCGLTDADLRSLLHRRFSIGSYAAGERLRV